MFIPKTRRCPRCKTTMDANAAYCPHCGGSMLHGRGPRKSGGSVPPPAWLVFVIIGIPAGILGACGISGLADTAATLDAGFYKTIGVIVGLAGIATFLALLLKAIRSRDE